MHKPTRYYWNLKSLVTLYSGVQLDKTTPLNVISWGLLSTANSRNLQEVPDGVHSVAGCVNYTFHGSPVIF